VGARWPTTEERKGSKTAEEVALVATAKRDLLLQANRYRLRREDLEDCFSQATLELVAHARRGGVFADRAHLGNVLELRFLSRIRDRRRALSGRSPTQAALEAAMSLGRVGTEEIAIVDRRAELERLVILRDELRRIESLARKLTPDQRLVLASQLGPMGCREFCSQFGWTPEKYRKVAQRARAKLKRLMAADEANVPPRDHRSGEETGPAYDYLPPYS
jgi:DNA-directed RNA polymerase specialized sigma24 family protein